MSFNTVRAAVQAAWRGCSDSQSKTSATTVWPAVGASGCAAGGGVAEVVETESGSGGAPKPGRGLIVRPRRS